MSYYVDHPAISLQSLSKSFQNIIAVDSIDLEIAKGELFGLLGPNGAGKSTIIKMLTTMVHPSKGKVKILGHDTILEKNMVRSLIGVVFQDATLDAKLTAKENLEFHAQLYGLNWEMRLKRIEEVLQLVDLRDKADVIVENYSGGMQRRLAIARGLINHPQVLFLDEPTLGLDAQTRRYIWEYIKELNMCEDMTILLTTHYLEEADQLCERVAIMDKGRIVALDTPERLKNYVGADKIVMQVQNASESFLHALRSFPWIISSNTLEDQLVLHVDDAQSRIPQVIIEAFRENVTITSVNVVEPSLEDVFLKFTGRNIREVEAFADPLSKPWLRRKRQ